ncbi:unnamed protein product, partial [Closterium sp. NIES-53]
ESTPNNNNTGSTGGSGSGEGSMSTVDGGRVRTRQLDIRDVTDARGREHLDLLWMTAVADNDWAFRVS